MNSNAQTKPESSDSSRFFTLLARAAGGSLLFSIPLLMTMEMWRLGFYISGWRLALFTVLTIPLLIGLSYYDGFETTSSVKDDIVDMFVAYAVGFVTSTVLLFLFGICDLGMSGDEIIGKISIQAVIGSFGAMFAQSLLTGNKEEREESENRKRETSYFGEVFLMMVGALFLSMSVAPTEEMVLISYQMTGWHTLALAVGTICLMQAFFYAVDFRGFEAEITRKKTFSNVFLYFTSVGYAMVLVGSFYILWTFGSIDGMGFGQILKVIVVLSFPAAVGASASRLIL